MFLDLKARRGGRGDTKDCCRISWGGEISLKHRYGRSTGRTFIDAVRRTGRGPLVPSFTVALRLLLLVRAAGAMYSLISDCDEGEFSFFVGGALSSQQQHTDLPLTLTLGSVFNFIEPLHYFQHNSGFQTWELSPQYAIRSWAYVLLHWPLAHLMPIILRVGKVRQTSRIALPSVAPNTEDCQRCAD